MASSIEAAGGGGGQTATATPGSPRKFKCSVCGEFGHDKRRHASNNVSEPLEDHYTEDILRRRYTAFRAFYTSGFELKDELDIRMPNMPEDISENITKFIIRNRLGLDSQWARHVKKPGDLWSHAENVQESKCFMSDGPCSFGPDKVWNVIYFLDLRKWVDDEIAVFRCTLTPQDEAWQCIRMSKTETWKNQVDVGRRPHIGWEILYPQIKDHCTEVYRGSFEDIFSKDISLSASSSTTGTETAFPANA